MSDNMNDNAEAWGYKGTYYTGEPERKPYCCPVCNGRGVLPQGFYNTSERFASSSLADIQCRSCNGRGIIIL